jgi:sterol desaturase/sphingolipid hydroxylase (fatty acid hydroxylase superfamily)
MLNLLESLHSAFLSWWFDPLVASLGFMVPVYIYTFCELQSGTSSFKSFREFLWTSKETGSFLMKSLLVYWLGILIWVRFVPSPGDLPSGIPDSLSSFIYLATEVVTGIVQYDIYFFLIHWAMHECKYLNTLLCHKEHHTSRKMLEARHVLRHSFLDGSLQVLTNIAVQRYTPWGVVKSRLARALHNIILTWMLTESHSSAPYPNVFRRQFVGVREHRWHHLCGDKTLGRCHRYQQIFGYLDDLHNTVRNSNSNFRMKKK